MKVIITAHAKKRLLEGRQRGITISDITRAVEKIPGQISSATRFRGFISTNGKIYDIVAKDIPNGRLVITIIGKQ
ncbi:hypothetical protein [Caldalkalibacillus salinus]|uniref:hypothetical protein n=1 Tax=Caldalkalibacillus salinus TaxID=2803787 RepID=UPI001923F51B|nr:hypothetical protein [Caldalkalibacillus salinus]